MCNFKTNSYRNNSLENIWEVKVGNMALCYGMENISVYVCSVSHIHMVQLWATFKQQARFKLVQ